MIYFLLFFLGSVLQIFQTETKCVCFQIFTQNYTSTNLWFAEMRFILSLGMDLRVVLPESACALSSRMHPSFDASKVKPTFLRRLVSVCNVIVIVVQDAKDPILVPPDKNNRGANEQDEMNEMAPFT